MNRLALLATCLTLVRAQESAADCFASGSIVGAVLGTFFATAITIGLIAYLLWWFHYKRHDGRKGARAAESGFDNPCFDSPANADDAVDGEAKHRQEAKSTSWTPLRFFGPIKSGKKRALDDSFVSEPEHVSVQLRGHDFTGLGFNVTGNMRDGIFVKDILNRGPAFESGRIAQGDKILGVTISFRHIVYEDALTILSYASPYDVTLELEKGQKSGTLAKQRKAASTGSLASASAGASLAVSAGQLPEGPVIHPLYRSQSIDDLSKVGRDASVRADVRIPNLSGGLIKSKQLGKAHVEAELPDVKLGKPGLAPAGKASGKLTKFGIKVLPDLKVKSGAKEVSVTELPVGLGELPSVEVHVPKPADVALDIDVPDSGPALPKADVRIEVPQVKPDIEVSVPGVSIGVKDSKSSFRFPSFGGGKKEASVSVAAEVPEAEVDVKLKKDKGGLRMPKLSTKKKGDADVKGASVSVDVPEVNVDVKVPKVELTEEAKKSKIGLSLPKLSLGAKGDVEGVKLEMPDIEVDVKSPTVEVTAPEIDVKAPEVAVKAPEIEVDLPSVEGKKSKMGFSLPKFGFGGKAEVEVPDIEAPKVEIETGEHEKEAKKKSKFGFNMKMPKIGGSVNLPETEVSVEPPKLDVELPKVDVELPKFEVGMPKVDVEMPKAEVEVEVPKIEDEEKKKGSKFGMGFKMPKFGISVPEVDVSAPKVDINLPSVEVTADVSNDVEVPKVDVTLPSVDVKTELSEDVEGKKSRKFGIKLPKFGFGGSDVDVEAPNISASVEMPSIDVKTEESDDEEGAKKKGKFGFGIKMPKFGMSAPAVDVSLPKVGAEMPQIGIEMPQVDVELPEMPRMDVELPKIDVELPKVDVKLPEVDVELPKVDVALPKVDVALPKVDVALPKVDVALPKLDVEMPKLDVEMPKLDVEMPKMGVKLPSVDVEMPKVDVAMPKVDVALPKVDVALPKVDVALPKMDVALPKVDVALHKLDVEMPKMGVKLPSVDVEMPKVDVAMPKVNVVMPKVDVAMPKVDVALREVKVDVELPKLDVELPKLDVELPKLDVEMPKLDVEMPKVDVNLPQVEFETSKVELETPKLEVDMPKIDISLPKVGVTMSSDEDDSSKKKGFSLKLPKFGFSKPEIDVKLPEVEVPSVNAEIPKVQPIEVNVELPKADVEIPTVKFPEVPKTDIEIQPAGIEMPDIEGKKSKIGFSLPRFNLKGDSKEAELKLEAPEVKVDLPEVKADLPEVNVELPEIDLPSVEGKKSRIGFHLPKFHLGGKAEAKDAELSVEGVETEDHEKEDAEGGVKKKKGGFHIKMPKFGSSKAEVELPDVNVDLPDVKAPEGKLEFGVEAELPKVDVEVPEINVEVDPKLKKESVKAGFEFKMPKLSMKKKGDADVKVELSDVDVKLPEASVELDAPEERKKSKMGFSMPKFHLGGKGHGELKESGIEVNVDVPKVALPDVNVNVEVPEAPKVELPDVSIEFPSAGVELTGPEVAVDVHPPEIPLPEVSFPEVDLPSVSVEGKKQRVGFHLPKFGLGGKSHGEMEVPDVELPKIEVEASEQEKGESKKKSKFGIGLKMPKISASAPEAELSVEAPKVDVNLPKVDVELPRVEIKSDNSDDEDEGEGGAKKKKGFHLKMPKFGAPKAEIDLPSVKIEADIPEVKAPETSIEITGPKVSLDEGPKKRYKFGFGAPKVQAEAPQVDVSKAKIELPEFQLEAGIKKVEAELEGEHEDEEDKKKKSKFSIKMPKFHMKKRAADVDLDKEVAVHMEGGLEAAAVVDDNTDDNPDKRRGKISVKMPKFSMKKPNMEIELPDVERDVPAKVELEVNTPDVSLELPDVKLSKLENEVDVSGLIPEVAIEKPKLDVEIEAPAIDLSAPGPSISLDLPKADIEIDADDGDDEKKKSNKFSFKLPKFHLGGKHHGEVKVEPPSVKLEVPEAEISVQPPSLELDASLGVAVHDDDTDEKDGTKKKSRFGIKLPKFQMNKPHLSGGVDTGKIDEAGVAVKLPSLTTVEAEVEDMDVVLPKAEVEITALKVDPSIEVEPDGKKKAKFNVKKTNFKMPKISMSGKGNVDIEAPDVSLPKVELEMPKVEAALPKFELDVKTEAKDDDGEFTINIPKMDIDLPEVRPTVTLSPASIEVPSIEAKVDIEPTKKSPFIDKMPELDPVAAGIDLSLAKARIDYRSDDSDDEATEDEVKSYKLGLKMPKFSFGAKGIKSVDIEAPGVDVAGNLEVSAPSVSLEGSEVDSAGLKISAKAPKMRQRVPDVVLPQIELKADPVESDEEGKNIKKPMFGFKLPTIEFNKPKAETEIAINLPRVDVQPTYAAESMNFELEMPQVELDPPSVDVANIDAQMENLDAEVAKTKAQLAQLQAELDVQAGKKPQELGSDDEEEPKTKSSGFHLGLKMPKFHLGKEKHEAKVEIEVPSVSLKSNPDEVLSSLETEPVKLESSEKEKKKFGIKTPKFQSKASEAAEDDTEPKSLKVNVKAPKVKSRKTKKSEQLLSGEESGDDHDDHQEGSLMDVEVKLPRVQVYKNVEYHDTERAHESSSEDEDENKDIKKNIGAKFGIKLKKPKMFSSNKIEISSKSESAPSTLQPEWKLPRVDLRRSSKSSDQELSVDVDLEIDQQRLEQLSPSERAEAIRRDAKTSAGIRLHSPSYISKMHSPRSKKSSLEMMDTDNSPRLLSVTRLDSVPGSLSNIEISAPQISPSQVPSTLLAASDAVKLKRGPPTPVKRSVTDPFRVAIPITTSDESAIEIAVNAGVTEPTVYLSNQPQASDTDISVATSVDSDTVKPGTQEAPSRKASSLGDLTRIPTSASEDGSLERTVSLDFKPVSNLGGASGRAIYNLAVQDLSRVGEDSDEDYNLNRKRSTADSEVTLTVVGETPRGNNRTILTIDPDGDEVNIRPLDPESLWFGAQTVESAQIMQEESISTDVTLTTTSLGTSPSETSSGSEGCPTTPASPEPNLINQVENGRQFTAEIIESTSNRAITIEMTEEQPQPLTDLNPSAGSFAAVRNRFEQLSGNNALNGTEPLGSPSNRPRMGNVVKRLSGTFEESTVIQKTIMQMAPEVSEGALSRTVIISSLHLTESEATSESSTLGPESPVPKLEPPC